MESQGKKQRRGVLYRKYVEEERCVCVSVFNLWHRSGYDSRYA